MAAQRPLVLVYGRLKMLPSGDSMSWSLLSDVPAYATRWPAWDEVTGKPTLGTAAAQDNTAFATAAQGTLAASALQTSQLGAASGVAPLGSDTKIAAAYLPSYVDDVLEYTSQSAFPTTGETGKIYVAQDTNKAYRWGGSSYIEISPSPGSTDSVAEGAVNLYFTAARASAAAPVQSVAGRTGTVTLTKSDVGLSNVDNTSDANKPISTATQTALNAKANSASPTFTGTVTATSAKVTVSSPLTTIAAAANNPATGIIAQSGASSGSGDAAYINFIRQGNYGAFFGLDSDNTWKIGGGSMGTVSYSLWHSGNFTPSAKQDALGYTPMRTGTSDTADLNNYTLAGAYRFNVPSANGPGFTYGQLLVVRGSGDTVAQIALDYGSSAGLAWRGASGASDTTATSWQSWKTIWHSANSAQVIVSSSTPTVVNGAVWIKP